jgi:uncharacterized membrane protein
VPRIPRRLESGTSDRLNAFSDAVVSIAITLLALELPVPEGHTAHEFWHSIGAGGDEYLAFVISFAVIARSWSQHHHVFSFAERSDSTLRSLNMLWLLTVILNPFATKLLTTESGDTDTVHALRWSFYAGLQVLATVTFLAMVQHMLSAGLQAADTPDDIGPRSRRRAAATLFAFTLSIPLFFVTRYAWLLWLAVSLTGAQIGRLKRSRQRAVDDATAETASG